MQALDILKASGGIEEIATQLGISPAVAQTGSEALLPAILGGFSKQGGGSGLGGLGAILGQLGGAGIAANDPGAEPSGIDLGNAVLGQIFGSKDVSRSVAGHASERTGLDPALLKKMLPMLAMLVAGHLASGQTKSAPSQGGGLGSVFRSILGSGQAGESPLGELGALLDFDHDGNPLDDIIGMAGKLTR